jgi:ABC-type maltose transport system permease subunit
MSTLSLVPVFLVFLLGQRLIMRGIATQGLKG